MTDYEKAEKWINGYIKQGYRLKKVNPMLGKYEFEKCDNTENNHIVRIDYRTFANEEEFISYVSLFEDSGWHLVWGSKSSGTLYFERMKSDAEAEIFSDEVSKAARYKRLLFCWGSSLVLYLVLTGSMIANNRFDLAVLANPKSLYYTPGLWEREGVEFWRAFLFETPFAMARGYMGIIILLFTVLLIYLTIKTVIAFWKTKNS